MKEDESVSSERLALRVEPGWLERARFHAKAMGLTVSAYVKMAVSERMARDEQAAWAVQAARAAADKGKGKA